MASNASVPNRTGGRATTRFRVRPVVSDLSYVLYRVWDARDRRFVFMTTGQADAERYARQFERAHLVEAASAPVDPTAWR